MELYWPDEMAAYVCIYSVCVCVCFVFEHLCVSHDHLASQYERKITSLPCNPQLHTQKKKKYQLDKTLRTLKVTPSRFHVLSLLEMNILLYYSDIFQPPLPAVLPAESCDRAVSQFEAETSEMVHKQENKMQNRRT